MRKIKNFFSEGHSLLFFAAGALFLQFAVSVVYFYMQAVLFYDFNYLSDFAYLAYCLAVFAALAVLVLRNQKSPDLFVRLWFSVILLYACSETAMFIKMLAVSYGDSIDSIANLWDNQHLYRLYMCAGAAVLIYLARYILKARKTDLVFAGANLLGFLIFILCVPEMGELLLVGEENILQVAGVVFVREIAVL
ncbi:MAG: hypothetical protein FWD23_13580, partial [Oscillospiraceae bacterium]|nr:hypothetical protein [Oscillospiraceae bacterium]